MQVMKTGMLEKTIDRQTQMLYRRFACVKVALETGLDADAGVETLNDYRAQGGERIWEQASHHMNNCLFPSFDADLGDLSSDRH